jgi:hypothetical protein
MTVSGSPECLANCEIFTRDAGEQLGFVVLNPDDVREVEMRDKSTAVVLANSKYPHIPLSRPLADLGFDERTEADLNTHYLLAIAKCVGPDKCGRGDRAICVASVGEHSLRDYLI